MRLKLVVELPRIYWPKFSESNLITIADYEVLEMSDFVIGANIEASILLAQIGA